MRLWGVFESLDYKVLDFYQKESIANSDDVWLSYILRRQALTIVKTEYEGPLTVLQSKELP